MMMMMMMIYMYVCIYCALFGPVKTGVGSNSIRSKKTFNSRHLNFPGKELKVTDIKEK